MGICNDANGYGWLTKLLHWAIALIVIGMVGTMLYAEELPDGEFKFYLYGIHKACGLAVLALVTFRILWHQLSPTPTPYGEDGIQRRAAKLVHRLWYLVLFVMPITGVIMSHYSGRKIDFFGLFTIPGAESKVEWFAHLGHDIHMVVANLIYVLFAAHVGAALYHHIVCKDVFQSFDLCRSALKCFC